jgi:cell division inhibitor SulA/protein ImuA
VELLIQQPGIGEVRMLQPALTAVAKRPIVLVKPPHVPNAVGFAYTGIPLANLMLLNTQSSADLLWSAEQILKTGSCGALLLWQQHMRADSLRRLSLNAQASETLLFVMRPLAARQDASPAALRLAIRPTADGVSIDIVKRKGPIGVEPFDLVLKHSPVLLNPYGRTSKSARKIEPVASPMTVSTAG